MDISRAVSDFVSRGTELFERLSSEEGETLTETELSMLRAQLHVLNLEASHLQSLRALRERDQSRPEI